MIKKQQQIHKRIKYQSISSKSNGIYFIDILIDNKIAWNQISNNLPCHHWKRIKDPNEIENCIIKINKEHPH